MKQKRKKVRKGTLMKLVNSNILKNTIAGQ